MTPILRHIHPRVVNKQVTAVFVDAYFCRPTPLPELYLSPLGQVKSLNL